jgi:hypothetical protein
VAVESLVATRENCSGRRVLLARLLDGAERDLLRRVPRKMLQLVNAQLDRQTAMMIRRDRPLRQELTLGAIFKRQYLA